MADMPTDVQIYEFAKKIGALSPDGSRFTEPRNKLAAGAQKWLEELEAERGHVEPHRPRTVDELKRLHAELLEAFPGHPALAGDLLVSMASALVRRQGLQLKTKGNPRNV